MNNNNILKISLPNTNRAHFDYLANSSFSQEIPVGSRITVPFRNKQLIGIFTGYSTNSAIARNKLRAVTEVLDAKPPFSNEIIQLCQWAADYYHHPLGDVLHTAMPVLLRQGAALEFSQQEVWQLTHQGKLIESEQLKRAPKQQQALNLLKQHPGGLTTQVCQAHDVNRPTLQSLLAKELLVSTKQSVSVETINKTLEAEHVLNDEQLVALQAITDKQDRFHCFLLDGITGSGKTEIYLQAIKQQLALGKQTLVLIPEIGLTPQLVDRFQRRFNETITCLHSGLNDRERLNAWLLAKTGKAKIVIGTRSAIFTPMPSLGMIIIDEEHDTSFKQYDTFRYSARDLAIVRSKLNNIPIILGSATPSLESLHNVYLEKYELLTLRQRAGDARPPKTNIIDLRSQKLNEGLSNQLIHAMQKHLQAGNQVLLFINRRGYAPVMLCHQCGWIADCKNCAAHLIVHRSPPYMQCHHCGSMRAVIKSCPDCENTNLVPIGIGTERLEINLQTLFPDTNIARIDRDNTRRKGAMNALLKDINSGKANILIGTQMLAKGHHFPNVTMVGILDADSGLFNCDFRAIERLGQLLTQVSGRAGRAEKTGEVFIQTHAPDHPLLSLLLDKGYCEFASHLMKERQQAYLPPFAFLALFRAQAKHKQQAEQLLEQVRQIAERCAVGVNFLGPIAAPLEKKANQYRFQLLVQSANRQALQNGLAAVMTEIEKITVNSGVRWSLDVDPYDLG